MAKSPRRDLRSLEASCVGYTRFNRDSIEQNVRINDFEKWEELVSRRKFSGAEVHVEDPACIVGGATPSEAGHSFAGYAPPRGFGQAAPQPIPQGSH